MKKQVVYIAGLPRSGSTLLCQMLGMHPKVFSSGHSSPLAPTLEAIRDNIGNDPFFLSQLDIDPEQTHEKLKKSMCGFMRGWLDEFGIHTHIVDKNRQWLAMIETLNILDPNFKMIICIRNLSDIFASIENKHRNTILLPFPDATPTNHIRGRAATLFSPCGVIGCSLSAISNIDDIPNISLSENIFYVAYEALMQNPTNVMNEVYKFIGVDEFEIDINNLPVKSHESDSYYRMKYPHKTYSKIDPSFYSTKEVSPRIVAEIINNNRWFYEKFYPGILREFDKK